MQSINDKYIKQTVEALSSNRLSVTLLAQQISQLPVREQIRFFKLALSYIDIIGDNAKKGFTVMGLQEVAKCCGELKDVVDLHFPIEQDLPNPIKEYVQL